jgi:hypothetical protein
MIRLMLIGVIQMYRAVPPRRKRCSLTPGCSAVALAGVRTGQMGAAGVLRSLALCPEHPGG